MEPLDTTLALAARETESVPTIAAWASSVRVLDQSSADLAGRTIRDLELEAQALDEKRTSITRPILEAKRRVDEVFMPPIKALRGAAAKLREALSAYVALTDRRAISAVATGTAVPEIVTGIEGVHVTRGLSFEIRDVDALPREYLRPDEDKIAEAISRGLEIPGVVRTITAALRRKGARRA